MSLEKQVAYTSLKTYSTRNDFSPKTKKIWFVCHGLGYLSSYFINYFDHLDPDENYIVAPQAPSTYYQDKGFKYIGASWFTRLDLEQEIENVNNYLEALYKKEIEPLLNDKVELIFFGYSQGVSAVTRWCAGAQRKCDTLLLHSGALPSELNTENFQHLNQCRKKLVFGNEDEYITEEGLPKLLNHYEQCLGKNLIVERFYGKHEVYRPFLLTESRQDRKS